MSEYLDCRILSIFDLYRANIFKAPKTLIWTWNHSDYRTGDTHLIIQKPVLENFIILGYFLSSRDMKDKRYIYIVDFVEKEANFGGFRYYFKCPLINNDTPCRNRVSVLYRPKNSEYYGCRHCHKISYLTQIWNQKTSVYRQAKAKILQSKIDKLEEKGRTKSYHGQQTHRLKMLNKLRSDLMKYPDSMW